MLPYIQNGNWYCWGLLYTDKNGKSNTLTDYVRAWRHVIGMLHVYLSCGIPAVL
jgi:hypothetical protein